MNDNKFDLKIILENNIILKASSFGYKKNVYGSFIFNTSIVGYEEALTDPSYNSEILVMTFPLQGIYGINLKDIESNNIHPSAFVVNDHEKNWSNNHAKQSLDFFLNKNKILGVSNVDTRYLTKIIRTNGSLKGAIVDINDDENEVKNKIIKWSFNEQVKNVSPKKISIINSKGKKTISFYDFGAKKSIKTEFIKRGYRLVILPYNTTAKKALSFNPEFIFLSNGPGDPNYLKSVVEEIKKLMKTNIKIVGICLGHQLLGLATNQKIFKLSFGHHAINHPVKNIETNKVYITSQNHNFAIIDQNKKDIDVFLKSLNDNSIEGMKSNKLNFISTQFHPEASPGTSDANEIFDIFIEFNKKELNKCQKEKILKKY